MNGIVKILIGLLFFFGYTGLGQSNEINTIELEPGAVLDVGSATVTVSQLISLRADSAGYAQVMGKVEGPAEVESYLTYSSARWFGLSFPIDSTFQGLNISNGGFLNVRSEVDSNQVNAYWYNASTLDVNSGEGAWTQVNQRSESLEGKGYYIYLGPPYFGNLPVVISAKGDSLLNGSQQMTTGYVGTGGSQHIGWNLIANPYPSAISWNGLKDLNSNLNSTYYIQNGDGSWASFNGTFGIKGGADSVPTDYIAPMQSFFVQLNQAGDLTFDNSIRSVDQKPVKYKANHYYIGLRVQNDSTGMEDYIYLGFNGSFGDGFDPNFDGYKKMNMVYGSLNFFVSDSLGKYSYYGISDKFTSKSIPLKFITKEKGMYVLALTDINIPDTWQIDLQDEEQGKFVNLKQQECVFEYKALEKEHDFTLHINRRIGTEDAVKRDIQIAHTIIGVEVKLPEQFLGEVEVFLYDAVGRLIFYDKSSESVFNIYKPDRRGLYILSVKDSGQKLFTKKLIF